MPDWVISMNLWVKDSGEEEIAEMCQEIAQTIEETMNLEKDFSGVPRSESSGLLNVTYQEAFYHKTESEE